MIEDYDWDRLDGLGFAEDAREELKKACWKGYEAIGVKTKNGRTVPNCVPVKKKKETSDHKESDDPCWEGYQAVGMKNKNGRKVPNCVPVKKDAEHGEFDLNKPDEINDMAIGNALPKEPATGPVKNPQMREAGIRMPRMEEIAKASNRNGHLAMAAAPNYAETEDFSDRFHSDEPNAQMLITQLRVMREKIDIMLGMLYPDDNFEPWVATKIANAGVAVASVADYLRFGGET